MFTNSGFNQYIGTWNLENVTTIQGMFTGSSFNNGEVALYGISSKPIEWKNTDKITNMSSFAASANFNQELNFSVKNVTQMQSVFSGAIRFNQDISHWDTGNVVSMISMFEGANEFNNGQAEGLYGKPLNWNTSKVTNMSYMFEEAYRFNQPLNLWNTSKVTTMYQMFYKAFAFNQNITLWNVKNVTNWKNFSTSTNLAPNLKPLKFR